MTVENPSLEQFFLVQVAEKGSENILQNNMYRNEDWRSKTRDRDHGLVNQGDRLLVYFAGKAIEYQKQLGLVCKVTSVQDERKEFVLEKESELKPISRETLISKVRDGVLDNIFLNCGRQGFNICRITRDDYEAALRVAEQMGPAATTIGAESLLEDFVVSNWRPEEYFGPEFKDLEIVKDASGNVVGQQYDTSEAGIIDLLCRGKSSDLYVVIEIKRGNETSDDVVGQLARYVGWTKKNLAQGRRVVGIILCAGHDRRLDYAISVLPDCFIAHYDVRFSIKPYTPS